MKLRETLERMFEAFIIRIEGKDVRKKLDYLMKPDFIETSSILTPQQIDALTAMIQIGDMYPVTMEPLKQFARLYASWTPSKDGKGRDQLMQVMLQVAPESPQNLTQINTGGGLKGGEGAENK